MQNYESNKLKTATQIVQRIENWPTAMEMRLRQGQAGRTRLLSFRDGLELACRSGTRDWDVIHELLFAGSYARAFSWLAAAPAGTQVLDLGGNLGLFSLLSARHAPGAKIVAFEPGPPNFRMFEMNMLLNPQLASRVELRKQAVGGESRKDEWFFDHANPGGSSLFGRVGESFPVQIVAFKEVIESLAVRGALVKIDIEGAEYEILEKTPASVWEKVGAISLELHDDPGGVLTHEAFLERFRGYGFTVEEESVCSFFLHRP